LETAVADEMSTFTEEWEAVLDELETESAHLLVCFFLQLPINLFYFGYIF
jgi:hypothetical protein